jgi:hypothetical protein
MQGCEGIVGGGDDELRSGRGVKGAVGWRELEEELGELGSS